MFRRIRAVILIFSLFLPAAVLSAQNKDRGANVFTVNVINNTFFDIELVDESRIIPRRGQKRVSLPVFHNELQDGYSVNYRVPLLPNVFINYKRSENIIIPLGQDSAVIEAPDFTPGESFIIIENTARQSIGMKNGSAYINNLVGSGLERQYGTPYTKPKDRSLYDHIPAKVKLSLEADQYKSIPFPIDAFTPGYLYSFVFDGTAVTLTDARPLTMIGAPIPVDVAFSGDTIPGTEKEKLISELDSAFKRCQVPLYVGSSKSAPWEQMVHHTIIITITLGKQAPRPPLNREMTSVTVAVSLSRNGAEIVRKEEKKTVMNEADVYSAVAMIIRENTSFYNEITQYMRP